MSSSTKRGQKKEETRIKILQAAIDLINSQGFGETTMQHIASLADVSLRTLYNYFPSKEAIVATYMHEVVREEYQAHWQEVAELKSTHERLLFVCRRSADWSKQNRKLTEVYALDPRNYFFAPRGDLPRSGIEEVVAAIIFLGCKDGELTRRVSQEVLVQQFLGFYYMSILNWLAHPDQDLQDVFADGLNLVMHGIKNEGGRYVEDHRTGN